MAPKGALLGAPKHPYTEALLMAVPKVGHRGGGRVVTAGEPPDLLNLPEGCVFHPRCQYAKEVCSKEVPEIKEIKPDHFASCLFAEELQLKGIGG